MKCSATSSPWRQSNADRSTWFGRWSRASGLVHNFELAHAKNHAMAAPGLCRSGGRDEGADMPCIRRIVLVRKLILQLGVLVSRDTVEKAEGGTTDD